MVDYGSRRILGMRVDGTTYEKTADAITDMASAHSGGMVCVATVHMVMEAFDDPAFQRIVNTADRVTPDGVPLVKALRMLGIPQAQRVYGPTLTPIVCRRAEELGLPVGFYGGSPEVLDALVQELSTRFPKLRIPFAYSPPFRPLSEVEDAGVVDAIDAAGVSILFVGLGCPKQERWMAAHRESLRCTMVGVGAAFDFIAGAKSQAPRWVQRMGLEWLFRLLAEPRRLWRRYLIGNPRFLYHFALERSRARCAGRPGRANPLRERRDD
jgi:N-acetylglucosaminyldiphosphoundecaprenol N-acetyl-beta-D-mannosaminyltransferase